MNTHENNLTIHDDDSGFGKDEYEKVDNYMSELRKLDDLRIKEFQSHQQNLDINNSLNDNSDNMTSPVLEPSLTMPVQKQIWEQMHNESDEIYTAFRFYLDLGPKRSYRLVAQHSGKTKRTICSWSKTFNWLDRVDAFDRAKYLELKSTIFEHHSDAVKQNFHSDFLLTKTAADTLPIVTQFLKEYIISYNCPEMNKKLKYIILVCRAIKEVRSLINFFPNLSTSSSHSLQSDILLQLAVLDNLAPSSPQLSNSSPSDNNKNLDHTTTIDNNPVTHQQKVISPLKNAETGENR